MKNSQKTHCPQGHIYDKANTRISAKGGRFCRACDRDKAAARRTTAGPIGEERRRKNSERTKRWLEVPGNREKQNRTSREWQAAHADDVRNYRLQTSYGITSDDYDRLLGVQEGHCALCPAVPDKHRLAVDHDHQTGKIRGLLCFPCNRFVGRCENSPDLVQRVIQYLKPPLSPRCESANVNE